jgi:hypothetical protein
VVDNPARSAWGNQHHFERASGMSAVAPIATELLRYGKRALQYLTHWA